MICSWNLWLPSLVFFPYKSLPKSCEFTFCHCLFLLPTDSNHMERLATLYLSTAVALHCFSASLSLIFTVFCTEARWFPWYMYTVFVLFTIWMKSSKGFFFSSVLLPKLSYGQGTFVAAIKHCERDEVISGGPSPPFLPFTTERGNWHDSYTIHLREWPDTQSSMPVFTSEIQERLTRVPNSAFKELNKRSL